jgi:predicted Rossmann-fold nucleotide-binding protein
VAGKNVEQAVADLVNEFGGKHDTDYVTHMIITALGLGTDSTSTLDLKIASSALKEMREAFAMFDPYANRKKVTIFGSARTKKDDPLYLHTQNVAAELAAQGWMVVTGAGPGIMEAGMVGAGRDQSIGVSIRLPFEASANPIIAGDGKFVETFELLTLMQTGRGAIAPTVLLDLPGDHFWRTMDEFIQAQLLPRGLISASDLSLYRVCETTGDAVKEIIDFYKVFHSVRFVGKYLIIRMNHQISGSDLEALGYLCKQGEFETCEPTSQEIQSADNLDKARLRFEFVRNDLGGLRDVINRINQAG